jgi:hypothetical protein
MQDLAIQRNRVPAWSHLCGEEKISDGFAEFTCVSYFRGGKNDSTHILTNNTPNMATRGVKKTFFCVYEENASVQNSKSHATRN